MNTNEQTNNIEVIEEVVLTVEQIAEQAKVETERLQTLATQWNCTIEQAIEIESMEKLQSKANEQYNEFLESIKNGYYNPIHSIKDVKNRVAMNGTSKQYEVKQVGGNDVSLLLENTLLQSIQRQSVKDGCVKIGTEFIAYLSKLKNASDLTTNFPQLEVKKLYKTVSRYVDSLFENGLCEFDSSSLTDTRCFEILTAFCEFRVSLGLNFSRPNVEQNAKAQAQADNKNKMLANAVILALKGSSATV